MTTPPEPGHIPVLLDEILAALDPRPGETMVDLTAGRGGHALAFAERVGPDGRIVLFDRDPGNLAYAAARIEAAGVPVTPLHASFVQAPARLDDLGLAADVVLADLGFASNQMDDPERGLSFSADGPLDMRLDPTMGPTAADLLAALSERDLADLIYRVGEDPFARKIARKLVESRKDSPIHTTARLAELVVEAYGGRARSSRRHPATRTFMALRIAVNDELHALDALLDDIRREAAANLGRLETTGAADVDASGWLRPGARIGVISFHSLEDRRVKQAFARMTRTDAATALTRKPVSPDEDETAANPRARSAKFRALRLADAGPSAG